MLERFLENIVNPSEEFTPIPFWFFNDEPDREKIRNQLADYVEKGVHGIVLHPRIGLPDRIPYLSEAYFEIVKYIVGTADHLDMKIVLYDEGMYPSGSAHGLVVKENADYASKGITLSDKAEGGQVITRFFDGKYLIYGFTHGTIRGIHYGEDDGEKGAPPSADILNPEAVDTFIRLTHERYYRELKGYFGSTVIAFFTDEPCPLGRNAAGFREWTKGMEAEIIAAGGRLEELESLFRNEENRTTEIYHRLIKKHLRETYYARLSGWCEAHGVSLMGHPEKSDDVEEEFYFHIPGQDLIMRRVAPESRGVREPDSMQAALPADIARHLGRRRNANECFGVCNRKGIPWYFTGYDMKWYINWLGIRGVNLFIPHAFYYSVAGRRSDERPPDVGPNNIWWKHYRLFSDYMKRISYLMTDSVSLAEIAVLCDNNRVPVEEAAELYERQTEFHYLPVALLKDCTAAQNQLCIGTCRFKTVIDLYGYQKQEAYAKYLAGVQVVNRAEEITKRTVITEGDYPHLRAVHMKKEEVSWYLFSNEGEETIEAKLFIEKLQDNKKPYWISLWNAYMENSTENGAVFIEEGQLLVSPRERRLYDDALCIQLELEHCEMKLLLLLNEGEEEIVKKFMGKYWSNSYSLINDKKGFLGDWTQRFMPSDTIAFEKCCANAATETNAEINTAEDTRHIKNTATYRYIYQVSKGQNLTGTEYFKVRGEEMAECICNDKFAGVSFYGPHTFQIGRFLKEGRNEICLRFTENAANLYGTEKVPFGLG